MTQDKLNQKLLKDIEKNRVAKFIITLPEELLNPETVVSQGDKFDYGAFSTSIINVSVKIGSTKFKLKDVKNIEVDDIVVFDNSDINHMVIKFKDYEKEINLNPNLGLVIPVENEEGEDNMAGENSSLWDSIEVEMGAQFDTVKITLGDLKKIEEGLVVDLTSIYDNKVTLSVENKPIARGELVIVNDRYGVKIDEVIVQTPTNELPSAEVQQSNGLEDELNDSFEINDNSNSQSESAPQPQQGEQPASEEDEFDYSDFELEDEDI